MAHVSITLAAPVEKVWEALTRPEQIKQYFFGTEAETDWKPGSPIYFRGIWQGKAYEDKGKVIEVKKYERISFSHWSSLSGKPDLPNNYQIITYGLRTEPGRTVVTVDQDCPEQESESCESNWKIVLAGLKKVVE